MHWQLSRYFQSSFPVAGSWPVRRAQDSSTTVPAAPSFPAIATGVPQLGSGERRIFQTFLPVSRSMPAAKEWPILAGQNAPYLLKQLLAYKSGDRVNSHMAAVIARFGEPEFKALAAYYSQLAP